MKLWFVLLLCLGLPAACLPGQAAPLQHASIAGRDYVRLRDWTQAVGFKGEWLEPGRRALYTRGATRFAVSANSAVIQLNGVNVWLSYPVAARDGTLFVSELDLRATIQPLVSVTANPAGKTIKTITLDPGHGGKDTGNRVGREDEKKYTLLLAQEVATQLKALDFKVKFTRSGDKFVDLEERPTLARRGGADLFVSLHFNASAVDRNAVRGSEVYCLTPVGAASTNSRGVGAGSGAYAGNRFNAQNILLAHCVQKNLITRLGTEDRGVRRARFQVLRDATMPAVLIEAGFMSHPVEGRRIFDPAYRRQMARAIVSGIVAYRNAVER